MKTSYLQKICRKPENLHGDILAIEATKLDILTDFIHRNWDKK